MAHALRQANITVPAGNQISNLSTEVLFTDGYIRPLDYFISENQGQVYKFKAFGYISSIASAPGTLTLKIKFGTVILGTATITLPTSLSTSGFMLDGTIVVTSTGTSGAIGCQGFVIVDNAGVAVTAAMVNTGLTTTGYVTANTQAAASLGMSGQFSVANAGNIVTLSSFIIEEIQ